MTVLSMVSFGMTLVLGLIFLGLFAWGVRDGQFDDLEEAKYEMFRESGNTGEQG